MDENIAENKPADSLFKIIAAEALCTAALLLCLIAVKYFFRGTYAELKEWYGEYICAETDINEVLSAGGDTDEV